jgi:two-component sensor histidine kinase
LGLYCDLLEEPGVLATPFAHYGSELRLVSAASRRLVEKLVSLGRRMDIQIAAQMDAQTEKRFDARPDPFTGASPLTRPRPANTAVERLAEEGEGLGVGRGRGFRMEAAGGWDPLPAQPIANLAAELAANRNLLAALAGPSIQLTVDAEGGAKPVRLTGEDLTRVLVNLVKNSAEAMPAGGRIQIGLRELPAEGDSAGWLLLTIEDNGPGIARKALEKIFESGYTTRSNHALQGGAWPAAHRGLGLAIVRSIVEAAGGRIHATSRAQAGARLEIELPVVARALHPPSGEKRREESKAVRGTVRAQEE